MITTILLIEIMTLLTILIRSRFFTGLAIISGMYNKIIFIFLSQLKQVSTEVLEVIIEIDELSLLFISLTIILIEIGLIIEQDNPDRKLASVLILLIQIISIVLFSVKELILFYICFEGIIIPIYVLIGYYGTNKDAGNIIVINTLIGSLIMLIGILIILSECGLTHYGLLKYLSLQNKKIIWLTLFVSFAIKTPILPLHIWLPIAHTSANLTGSIILAAIVLKYSSYGFLIFHIGIMIDETYYFEPFIYCISTLSILYSSLTTLRQVDIKRIIAYSSIGHMSIINLGIFSNNIISNYGTLYLIVAHSIISPALFILVTILYKRYKTRIIKYYGASIQKMPIFTIFLLLFILASISIPITLYFFGELFVLIGSYYYNPLFTIIIWIFLILTPCYSIWLLHRLLFGSINPYLYYSSDVTRLEFHCLFTLFFILVVSVVLIGL